MLMEPMPTYAVALSLLDWQTKVALAQEKAVVKARQYHDGEQLVFLTTRLKQFLNANNEDTTFAMNVCRVVVEAVAERLVVKGFDCADKTVKAWAEQTWQDARMDAVSDDVHEQALRDGEAFVITDWDAVAMQPRFFSHPRYTSVAAGGDGFGVVMIYPDDDVSQPPLYAVKRWSEYVDEAMTKQQERATFYYSNRIEKFVLSGTAWVPIKDDESEPWPIPWVDGSGKPLGLPVIHFKTKGLRSEAWDAIPLQDAINKTLVDLLAAADLTGFRLYVALGFIPTTDDKPPATDGSNAITIEPGTIIGTNKPANLASFSAVDAADLTPTLNMLQQIVVFVAMITNTPVGRFQITGQVAAEGTLKQQEEPLMAKTRSRQILFGDAWEDAMNVARRLAVYFGKVALKEDVALYTQWADAQTRSDAERQAEWTVKKALGIPRRQLWTEMGYSPDKVQEMLNDPETVFGSFANYPAAPNGANAGNGSA